MIPRRLARFGDGSKYGKRHVPGLMNATESRYADILQARKLSGEIVEWLFESVTLKLAADCRYSPDFMVLHNDGSLNVGGSRAGPDTSQTQSKKTGQGKEEGVVHFIW